MAGRIAARWGSGPLNLGKPPRKWDTGGLFSKHQWNRIEEGNHGSEEGSEGAKATEFSQC